MLIISLPFSFHHTNTHTYSPLDLIGWLSNKEALSVWLDLCGFWVNGNFAICAILVLDFNGQEKKFKLGEAKSVRRVEDYHYFLFRIIMKVVIKRDRKIWYSLLTVVANSFLSENNKWILIYSLVILFIWHTKMKEGKIHKHLQHSMLNALYQAVADLADHFLQYYIQCEFSK